MGIASLHPSYGLAETTANLQAEIDGFLKSIAAAA